MEPGDEIVTLNGQRPRDVIEWQLLADEPALDLEVRRGGLSFEIAVSKRPGEPLGAEVHSPVFDQVRTCDNHCDFCFIYQLPPGLRRSLYVKDDDYRLSFLYGNFTTLTRFTEADLERVVTERLGPLYVSIHATDPDVRAAMLRNRRGATSLRWLRALLDHGVDVHGQIVVCPGVNDGAVLDDTLAGVLDQYAELASVCVVPLGISRHTDRASLRAHTRDDAVAVLGTVLDWQDVYRSTLGRRMAFAADEYFLLAGEPFPDGDAYEGFPQHENGVGMARAFEAEMFGDEAAERRGRGGFFAWVDGAPAAGYRAPRSGTLASGAPNCGRAGESLGRAPGSRSPVGIITGHYGASVLAPLLERLGADHARLLPVDNQFFGGNIAVTGLVVGDDVARVLSTAPEGDRYLLPDVCLSNGVFLDGQRVDDLPRQVEVVRTNGAALRAALVAP